MRSVRLIAAVAVLLGLASFPTHAFPPGDPDANVSWTPGDPVAAQPVTFVITAHDSDGSITGVTIDFGDGTRNSFPIAHSLAQDLTACVTGGQWAGHMSHQYAAPGSYPLTLVVTSGSCPITGQLQEQTTTVRTTIGVGRAKPATADSSTPAAPAPSPTPGS